MNNLQYFVPFNPQELCLEVYFQIANLEICPLGDGL